MKRLSKILIIIFILMLIPIGVSASGSVNVSTRNISLAPNTSSSFTITASNAVGRVTISTSNGGVASISTTSLWVENNSQTVTVSAGSVGSAVITVNLYDVATFDEEKLTGSYTINVTVVAPNNGGNNNNNNNNNTNPITNNTTPDNRSGNNNIKNLEVEGYKLTSKDSNNYTLTVKNIVDKIKIIASAVDSKATISGAGEKTLKVGDNVFQIVVTAENGAKKTYTITVTRKDDTYYLNDLDDAIEASKENIVITLNENDVLTSAQLQKIKKSNKNAYFTMKKDSKTLYSWMINSKNINNQDNIKLGLSFTINNKKKIEKLIDYRDGIYLNFSHSGNVPKNTVLRIYVAEKYTDGDKLHLYFLDENNDNITFIDQAVEVVNGYVEISINHCSTYFLTKAIISGENVAVQSTTTNVIPLIVIVVLLVLIICIIVVVIVGNNSISERIKSLEQRNEELEKEIAQEKAENNTSDENNNIEEIKE